MAQNRVDDTVMQVRDHPLNPFDEAYQDEKLPPPLDLEQGIHPLSALTGTPKPHQFHKINLDIMQQRFNVERGFFGRMAAFFAELSWWQKGLIGIFIGGIFAAVGAAISLAWVIALPLVAVALYAGAVFLFENYAQAEARRFEYLSEEVELQQEFTQEYHLSLEAVEGQHQQSIANLTVTNEKLTEVVKDYNQQAQSLRRCIQNYKQEMQDIEQLRTDLRTSTDAMQQTESQFSQEISELPGQFSQQLARLDSMANQATTITQSLKNAADTLKREVTPMPENTTPHSHRIPIEQLLGGYHFITEDEELHYDALNKRREESFKIAQEEDQALVQKIQALENSLTQYTEVKKLTASTHKHSQVTENLEQSQIRFNPRNT